MSVSAFPLPPGYTLKRRRGRWVYYEYRTPVSWARRDTRMHRLLLWERWVWGRHVA